MTNKIIPEDNHVLRYCTPLKTDNGMPIWKAFKPKETEKYLSVNWIEFYGHKNYLLAVDQIRKDFGKIYNLSKKGLFVMFHVSSTKKSIEQMGSGHSLQFKKEPCPNNPSHAGIYGIKFNDKKLFGILVTISKSCKKFPGLI